MNSRTKPNHAACLFGGALFHAGLAATAAAQPGFATTTFESIPNTRGYITAVVPVDLNGDGALDFLVNQARFGEGLHWYESDGQSPPAFTKRPQIGSTSYIQGDVVAADLDGDGDEDLILTETRALNYGVAALSWDENDGQDPPSFGFHSIESIGEPGNYAYAGFSDLTAADINGDGHIDLAVTGVGSAVESVVWFENDGAADPSFTRRVVDASLPLSAWDNNPAGAGSVRVADVTNDGHADLVVGASGSIVLYTSDGASPTPGFTKTTPAAVNGLALIEIADLNNDGFPEILYGTDASGGSTGTLGYLSNNGATPPVLTNVELATDGPFQAIEAGEIDQNGFADFIVTRGRRLGTITGNATFWYDNSGAGFTRRTVFGENFFETRWDSALIDIDDDGDLDIINGVRRTQQQSPFTSFDEIMLHENDLDPAAPFITMQPASRLVTAPAVAQFTVSAIGAGTLSYRWRLDGVGLVDGPGVSGALTDTLDVVGSTTVEGFYDCVVTNAQGSVVSAPALLAVSAAPSDCVGDLNGDGMTDVFDFSELAVDFGCGTE